MINRTIVISHKTFFKLLFQCYLIYKFNRKNNINANYTALHYTYSNVIFYFQHNLHLLIGTMIKNKRPK